MRNYELAVFDLDGTLIDTSEGILSSVRYTIDYFGFEGLSEKSIADFIGPPIQVSFSRAYGLEGPILQDIATVFRDHYKSVDLLKACPYEGIFDVLSNLKNTGLKLAVATYKREDYALEILKNFGFDKYFDVMHGGDHENLLKKSDIIELCIKESNIVEYSKVVLVGDTDNDEVGAKNVGVDFLGVGYGFGYKNSYPNNCMGFADSPEDIVKLLLRS